jgi:hypothetical protein
MPMVYIYSLHIYYYHICQIQTYTAISKLHITVLIYVLLSENQRAKLHRGGIRKFAGDGV